MNYTRRRSTTQQLADLDAIRSGAAVMTITALLGFAAVAWWPAWPISLPPYGATDGIVMVGLGVCLVGFVLVPALAAAVAASRRRSRLLLAAIPLGALTLYVGYFWAAVVLYFRNPEVAFIW